MIHFEGHYQVRKGSELDKKILEYGQQREDFRKKVLEVKSEFGADCAVLRDDAEVSIYALRYLDRKIPQGWSFDEYGRAMPKPGTEENEKIRSLRLRAFDGREFIDDSACNKAKLNSDISKYMSFGKLGDATVVHVGEILWEYGPDTHPQVVGAVELDEKSLAALKKTATLEQLDHFACLASSSSVTNPLKRVGISVLSSIPPKTKLPWRVRSFSRNVVAAL
jgi:hypothetical protein